MRSLLLVVLLLLMGWPMLSPAQEKPRVLLLGDSIRMGYAPLVAQQLDSQATVSHPGNENGGDSANTLKNLDRWLDTYKPDVVHFNCGLHDLKFLPKTMTHQVPLADYRQNLTAIVERLHKRGCRVVFANTTPVLDDRHAARQAGFERFNKDVQSYNAAAQEVLTPHGVPVHDLYELVQRFDARKLLGKDGTHFTPEGNQRLAEAVADALKRQLYALNPPKLTPPKAGPDAAAEYFRREAEESAKLPEIYRNFRSPEFPLPKSEADWRQQRPLVREKVVNSLGVLPPRPSPPRVTLVSLEQRPHFRLERLRLHNGLDGEMSAMIIVPNRLKKPAPAILWLHSSSYDHRQLLVPNTNGGETPLAEEFGKRGWVVFAPDAAWYGDRAGQGPGGPTETTTNQQASQHKFHQLFGRTLWGQFVRDDQVALDYLRTRPEVDADRIGATGISMGSTRSWWLAAVDERVKCLVGVACLTRYEQLIRTGQLRQHGVYYYPFGLLQHFDTEGVLALLAPRPVLFLTGELDAGSPARGIRILNERTSQLYAVLQQPERFRSILYPEVGHTYTPTMRQEMLKWFETWLK